MAVVVAARPWAAARVERMEPGRSARERAGRPAPGPGLPDGALPDCGLADRELAGLGHELRTPLNAILGYVELMLDGSAGPLDASGREYCGHIQDAGRRLGDLVAALVLIGEHGAPGDDKSREVDVLAPLCEALAGEDGRMLDLEPPGAMLGICGGERCRDRLALLGRLLAPLVAAGRGARLTLRCRDDADVVLTLAFGRPLCGGDGEGRVALALARHLLAARGGLARIDPKGALELVWPAERVLTLRD